LLQVYHTLKSVIKKKYGQDACNVGDEGGFAPSIQSNYEGVDLLMEAIKKAGYEKEVKIGMDVAASEFLTKDGKYDLDFKSPNNDGKMIQSGPELAATYRDLCKKYPIISVEDPFDQVLLHAYSQCAGAATNYFVCATIVLLHAGM
jgi:enolase